MKKGILTDEQLRKAIKALESVEIKDPSFFAWCTEHQDIHIWTENSNKNGCYNDEIEMYKKSDL